MTMKSFAWRRLGVAAAALTCAAAVAPAAASAAPSAPAAVKAAANVSAAPQISDAAWAAGRARFGADVTESEALAAYWTPERMRAATPVEEAPFLADALERYEGISAARERKAALKAKKRVLPPKAGREVAIEPVEAAAEAPVSGVAAAFNPNLSFSHPTARTNGKVFFTKNGVRGYQCSAAVVNSEGRDTVWTAGHCVHGGSGGSWMTDWQFVPAYDDDLADPRPYGTWSSNQLWSRTAWTNNSDFAEDMGVAILNTRNGLHIVDQMGGHGFRVNAGKNVFEQAFGYPSESPFDGGNLMNCAGTSSPEWQFLFWSSETIKISCDMTRGSSGGPWLHGYNGSYGYLNGVNSRIDRIVGPTIMLSPYFDDTALSLYNATRHL